MDIRRKEIIKDPDGNKDSSPIGHIAKIKVIKNKVAAPFKTCEVPLIYGRGIDFEQDLLIVATNFEIIKRNGSHYSYDAQRLGNGALAAATFLRDNPHVAQKIDQEVRKKLSIEDQNKIIIDPDKDNKDDENLTSED